MKRVLLSLPVSLCLFGLFGSQFASAQTTLDSEEWAFLTLINNYRAQNGAGPLQVSVALENSSTWMSTDMATKNYFSHTDSLGRDPFTRMAAFGYSHAPAGENIAAGNATAQASFTQWQTACDADASGNCTYAHRQNMLNPSYVVIGIGRVYSASSTYGWYWTTDFGGFLDATIPPPTISNTPPSVTSVNPTSGTGTTQTFTYVFSDSNGYTDINYADARISTNGSAANACWVAYVRASNSFYLVDDSGSNLVGPVSPGSNNSVQNSQCTLKGTGSSATPSGNNLTLNVNLAFKSTFTGSKTNSGFVQDNEGSNSGWQNLGTWNPAASTPPSVTSVSPNSGSATTQTFTYTFGDSNGYSDIYYADAMISTNGNGANACWVAYVRAANALYLLDDKGSTLQGPITPGSAGTLQNSQCTLNGQGSSSSGNGNTLTLAVSLTFKSGFTGTKTNSAFVQNVGGQSSGWQTVGSWTIGSGGGPAAGSVNPSSGAGTTQTFGYTFTDPNGATDIYYADAKLSSNGSGVNACWVAYVRASNALYLVDDTGANLLGPVTPSTSKTVTNGQCTLNGSGSTVTSSGNTMTMNLNLTFKAAFDGAKNNYSFVQSNGGLTSGWQKVGTWTVQ